MKRVSPAMKARIAALRGSPESVAHVKPPSSASQVTPLELRGKLDHALRLDRIGLAFAELRAVRGLTTRELGQRVGLSQPRVTALEKADNVQVDTLLRLSDEADYDVVLMPRRKSDPAFVLAKR